MSKSKAFPIEYLPYYSQAEIADRDFIQSSNIIVINCLNKGDQL